MSKKVNVFCIKWGTQFGPEYVNNLYAMVKRNTSYDINFYCFTEDSDDLNDNIIIRPLPTLNTSIEFEKKFNEKKFKIYQKEVGLCDGNLGGLRGKRVFFFDLDMVIVSNLDELFSYPKDDGFYIIRDWNSKGNSVGQASSYSWIVGTLDYIKDYYEKNPEEVINNFYTAAQEYLSSKVIEKYGKLNFWPETWFCSFRYHCMRPVPLRYFLAPKIPTNKRDLKVIVFHGTPNPPEAILGKWNQKDGKNKWRKIYKVCKPALWITKFWNDKLD